MLGGRPQEVPPAPGTWVVPPAPGRDAMPARGRWPVVDGAAPDAAYAMSYSLPRRGYALYVRHVTMLVHTVYILSVPRDSKAYAG